MPEDKLDKPSQIQFAEAITANIPEVDRSNKQIVAGAVAAYILGKAYKRDKRK